MISTNASHTTYNTPFQGSYLTITDVIEFLNISRSTYYRFKERPDFPKSINLGERTIRYNSIEIEQWLEKYKNKNICLSS